MFDFSLKPKPKSDIICRKIGGEFVLIPIRSKLGPKEFLYGLNKIGAAIWKELDGKKSCDLILKGLAEKTKTPISRVKKDGEEFLFNLQKEGLIQSG